MLKNISKDISKDLLIRITECLINGNDLNSCIGENEEKFFPITIDNDEIFYHGTSELLGKIIDQDGICSSMISEVTPQYTDLQEERIYLTKNINDALIWANARSKFDESFPVIFKVTGKDINASNCKVFPDSLLFAPVNEPDVSIVIRGYNCIKASRL